MSLTFQRLPEFFCPGQPPKLPSRQLPPLNIRKAPIYLKKNDPVKRDRLGKIDSQARANLSPKITITSPSLPKKTYTVLQKLGKGSYATVYKVQAAIERIGNNGKIKIHQHTCAIKLSHSTQHCFQAQIEEENFIRKIQRTPNPHIIKIEEGFSIEQPSVGHVQRCTVYELLFQNLNDAYLKPYRRSLRSNPFTPFPRMTLDHVKTIASQLLQALVTLETAKIIHADIKPENILLVKPRSLEIRLADFGISRSKQDPQLKHRIQTMWYRAPEVALGLPYDEKIDIWSTACVLVELYVGKPLFPAKEDRDKKCEHQNLLTAMTKMLGTIPLSLFATSCFSKDETFLKEMMAFDNPSLFQFLFDNKTPENLNQEKHLFFDLINHMLAFDPHQRFSAQRALQHPFFRPPTILPPIERKEN